jgi:hypothetical protein
MRNVTRAAVLILAVTTVAVSTVVAKQAKTPTLSTQDYVEIQQLYARYNDTVDKGKAEGWAKTFTADGVWKSGTRTISGYDALLTFIKTTIEGYAGAVRHWNSNLVITPSAEGATGTVFFMMVRVGGGSTPPTTTSTGLYEDTLVKTPEGWRFKRRQFNGDRVSPAPARDLP